jgi:phosphate/sulfate permease
MVVLEIEKIQGSLNRETLQAHHTSGAIAASTNVLPTIAHSSGMLHWTLFALMLAHAAMSALMWMVNPASTPLGIITGTIGAAVLLTAILAAFKQHRSDMARNVRWVVYSTFVFYVLDTIASFAVSISVSFKLISKGIKPGDTHALLNHPAFKILRVADISGFLILGCIGLILLWLHQRSNHTPPPLVTSENAGIQADGA